MPALLIRGIPLRLYRMLKKDAAGHHRSMTQHVLAILHSQLAGNMEHGFPEPVKGKFPLKQVLLTKGIENGRA